MMSMDAYTMMIMTIMLCMIYEVDVPLDGRLQPTSLTMQAQGCVSLPGGPRLRPWVCVGKYHTSNLFGSEATSK